MTSPLTADYQVGLGSTKYGASSSTPVSILSIKGLGSQVRSNDANYDLAAGAVAGADVADVRVVTIEMEIFDPGNASSVGTYHQAIAALFAASNTTQTLYVRFPGIGHLSMQGRTRGMDDDGLADLPLGLVQVTCRFDALVPTMTAV